MSRVPGYAPIIEYCGGTEIAGSFLSSTMVQVMLASRLSPCCRRYAYNRDDDDD